MDYGLQHLPFIIIGSLGAAVLWVGIHKAWEAAKERAAKRAMMKTLIARNKSKFKNINELCKRYGIE